MKKKGIVIGKEFKVLGDKVFKDAKAVEAGLSVSARIQRRKSKRIKFVKNPLPERSGD